MKPCCTKFNEDYKNKDEFYYCFKYTGKFSWFFKFLSNDFQKDIFLFSGLNFILDFTTIGFNKLYEESKKELTINESNIKIESIIIYFLTFGIFLFLSYFIAYKLFKEDKEAKEKEEKEEKEKIEEKEEKEKIEKEEEKIEEKEENFNTKKDKHKKYQLLGVSSDYWIVSSSIIIFFLNTLFTFIFSCFYYFGKKDYININENKILLIPIILKKLFYFALTKYCSSFIGENKSFEFLANSTSLSFYNIFWNIIIRLFLFLEIKILLIIQFIISIIIILIIILMLKELFCCDCYGNKFECGCCFSISFCDC